MSDITSASAIDVVDCGSWDEFKHELIRDYAEEVDGAGAFYRGHASSHWKLASAWERQLREMNAKRRSDSSRLLAKLLADFKDLTIGLPAVKAREFASDDDWWTLGRHYGLVTPLLDWTKSAYVAAFFAFSAFIEETSPGITTTGLSDWQRLLEVDRQRQVVIWSLRIDRIRDDDAQPTDLEIVHTRTDVGYRQRAQRGLFTRLNHENYFCLEDYLASLRPQHPILRQYRLPGSEAAIALTELRMMNITFATLFPDFNGAALQANFELVTPTLLTLSFMMRADGSQP